MQYDCCNRLTTTENTEMISVVSLLKSAFLNLHAISRHHHSHGIGMRISDLLKLWSIWLVSPVLSAAAGDRPTAGRAADGEEPAAQTHTEAAGSAAGGQTKREAQTHWQTKGRIYFFWPAEFIYWKQRWLICVDLTFNGLVRWKGLKDSTDMCGLVNGPQTSTQDPLLW